MRRTTINSRAASVSAVHRRDAVRAAGVLRLWPISLRAANAFIEKHHRHHGGRRAHRFAVSLCGPRGGIHGVAIAGNPIAKALCDGRTIEVSRTCTAGRKNANSMLYGAIWRAARALGYTRMVTYTLPEESGSSLRAIGMRKDGMTEGRPWDRPRRPRAVNYPVGPKVRWMIEAPQRGMRPPFGDQNIEGITLALECRPMATKDGALK